MTSKILDAALRKQIDLAEIDPGDLGKETDARPFITGTPQRDPSDFEKLSRAVAQLSDLRLALATQRGILRSDSVNDPVIFHHGGDIKEREFSNGEQAVKVIPQIRAEIDRTLVVINDLAGSLTRQGYKFGNFAGLVRSAAIDGNNAEDTRDTWHDAA